MLILSILYRLLRSLLGLTAVLMRRDLSKDAELLVLRQENTVLRRQVSRVRYTPADRGVAGRLISPGTALPLGESLPGFSSHDLDVAAQTGFTHVGLHRTPPDRASTDRSSDQEPSDSDGGRKPELGTPEGAGRTGPTRPSHRRLHRVTDPAWHCQVDAAGFTRAVLAQG
jgi:hypothetical protein